MTDHKTDGTPKSAPSQADFLGQYFGKRPIHVVGGPDGSCRIPPWDIDSLVSRVGSARVDVLRFASNDGDFGSTTVDRMSFADFVGKRNAHYQPDNHYYLFNEKSNIFRVNENPEELQVGWSAPEAVNPGLAPLGRDFEVPSFLPLASFLWAALNVGGEHCRTRWHFDAGGEGKVLQQVTGRKRVRLLPPTAGLHLGLVLRETQPPVPDPVSVERWIQSGGAKDSLVEFILEPGGLVYWPAHWFHAVENLDRDTVSVLVGVDEIPFNANLFGQVASYAPWSLQRYLRDHAEQISAAEDPASLIDELFLRYRRYLERVPTHRLTAWFGSQLEEDTPPVGLEYLPRANPDSTNR